jgi:hypothetical protein
MSAEEKAVRDALAVVQADTGVQKANEALGVSKPTPASTKQSLGGVSDIDTSTALGKQAVETLNRLQSFVDKTEPKIVKDYDALGYSYNPNTGVATPKTNVSGSSGGGATGGGTQQQVSKEDMDAFALLKDAFNAYGLSELAPIIEGYMTKNIGTNQATLLLKQEKAYQTRFAGNEARRAKGLNVLSEAEYLALEDSYTSTLRSYGLQDFFGPAVTDAQKKSRTAAVADIIGNDISAVEFKDRVSTAVDRVTNADAATKNAFKTFYGISDTDLVKYFLNPVQNLVGLKEKAAAAEVGGAGFAQGLTVSSTTAEDLARYGISKEQAQAGYSTIANILPTSEKLSAIYDEDKITYGQKEAEEETFKGLASAQRKRQQLAAKEIGTFSGQSGVNKSSLSKGSSGAF